VASRPLHIAVDGRELLGRPTGPGRYLREVLRCWSQPAVSSPSHRYTIVSPAEPGALSDTFGARVAWHVEPATAAGTLWEQRQLPRALTRAGADVLFAPAYTAPLRAGCPVVLAIHDVSYFVHPEWFSWREGLRRRWVTRAASRRAHTIATISQFSRAEIHRVLGIPLERIVLAPPGAPADVVPAQAPASTTVLFVGSLFQRRHPQKMVEAIALASRDVGEVRLILAGDNRTSPRLDPVALATAAGVADRVTVREYVSEPELAELYRHARVLLYLSDYEGFGIPPLEALAHGVAPVVLDTAVSREVYGDAAVRVAADPRAIAQAIVRLMREPHAHATIIAAGRAQLARYSWNDTARTLTQALERAAG
jgi:glycosyltransferase involved in cell wall biosynthesis